MLVSKKVAQCCAWDHMQRVVSTKILPLLRADHDCFYNCRTLLLVGTNAGHSSIFSETGNLFIATSKAVDER